MPRKTYMINLSEEDRAQMYKMTRKEALKARQLKRTIILNSLSKMPAFHSFLVNFSRITRLTKLRLYRSQFNKNRMLNYLSNLVFQLL
jgi:hypothetical protein